MLGDVVYSKNAMDRILTCDKPIMFFGCYAEIFALVWQVERQKTILDALDKCIERVENSSDKGTLHTLFRCLSGLSWDGNIERNKDSSKMFTFITCDCTQDIDSMSEYEDLLRKVKNNKVDDLP